MFRIKIIFGFVCSSESKLNSILELSLIVNKGKGSEKNTEHYQNSKINVKINIKL